MSELAAKRSKVEEDEPRRKVALVTGITGQVGYASDCRAPVAPSLRTLRLAKQRQVGRSAEIGL